MEKIKTFGELKKGDVIYFFYKGIHETADDLQEYRLECDPHSEYYENMIIIPIKMCEDYPCNMLEFDAENIEETLNLDDFDHNWLVYGDEYWYFTTDKETAIRQRKKWLEDSIYKTETNLSKLKLTLEKHIKTYRNQIYL